MILLVSIECWCIFSIYVCRFFFLFCYLPVFILVYSFLFFWSKNNYKACKYPSFHENVNCISGYAYVSVLGIRHSEDVLVSTVLWTFRISPKMVPFHYETYVSGTSKFSFLWRWRWFDGPTDTPFNSPFRRHSPKMSRKREILGHIQVQMAWIPFRWLRNSYIQPMYGVEACMAWNPWRVFVENYR